jgi:hypothetical protein
MASSFRWSSEKQKLRDQLTSAKTASPEMRKLTAQFLETSSQLAEFSMIAIRELAGAALQNMLTNEAATIGYLDHPDDNLRRAGILLVFTHWGPAEQQIPVYERLALRDVNIDVRMTALSCLATCFYLSNDARINRLVASIVQNSAEDVSIRHKAYACLFTLRGLSTFDVAPGSSFNFPEDVDWDFVRSFL